MAVGFSGENDQRGPAQCVGVMAVRGVARFDGLCLGLCLRLWLLSSLTVLAAGCAKVSRTQDVADAPERRKLLENIAQQVILPAYEDFAKSAAQLEAAIEDHSQVHTDSTRFQAQTGFRAAMLAWERAEMFQVGPAAAISNFNPGSGGLRNEIYAWDKDDACVVDRGLVREVYESDDFAKDVYFYGRGLGAIERLLFDSSRATACAASDRIATPEAWQALADGDLDQHRALYALAASKVVRERADQLVAAFRDDFMPELVKAGAGGRLFDRTQEALNAVTNALFYVDLEVRDLKVGGPLGRTMACMDDACATELPHARLSREALTANLEALKAIFVGAPPDDERGNAMWGLSDLLRSVQADSTAEQIEQAIDEALLAVRALGIGFDETPRDPAVHGAAAFDALQGLSDLLNTEFLQKLALSPPMRASGDND
jgi:predicted lipoprotein